ncbi:MAG: hypothetical protein IPM82_02505 [Saprospiraceae bacterium]|nr:hypothetical protein [Saprospiraceae bacterium]
MLNAKQFTIAVAAGLTIWLGTTHGKSLLHLVPLFTHQSAVPNPVAASPTSIQVALLLDTSGSMDGLIEQAKSQLWKILNELNRMRKNGEVPDLEVALVRIRQRRPEVVPPI